MINNQLVPFYLLLITLLIVATEKINRSVIVAFAALFLIIFRFIKFEAAIEAIDFNTLGLLIGMMIIVSITKTTGIFQYLALKTIKLAKVRPLRMLFFISILTAFLSAFLDNVTTILLVLPVIFLISEITKINSLPFVFSAIFFSNIGGAATLIGDPPNIIIGGYAKLDFNQFIRYNSPVVLLISFVSLFLVYLRWAKELRKSFIKINVIKKLNEKKAIKDVKKTIISVIVLLIVIIGFVFHSVLHIENSVIALFGAVLLLLLTRENPEEYYKEIEWPTIFFFIGLFVMIAAVEKTGIFDLVSSYLLASTKKNPELIAYLILWLSGFLVSLFNNIPITIILSKIILSFQAQGIDVFPIWWALSLGTCLGANLTLIASSVNIVGVDLYNRSLNGKNGKRISFINFFKNSFLITLLSLVISNIYLKIIFFLK